MSAPPKSVARIFVAFSDDPKRTLVLRRGPARHVAIFNWDRTTDTFTLGQWLKGRIYEHRLDVSPDGTHWIYLALQGGSNSHTVVARAPFLKALDFHPWCGTWDGGGHFISNKEYALSGTVLPTGRRLSGQFKFQNSESFPRHALYRRLTRQGWDAMLNGDYTFKLKDGWILRKHVGSGKKLGRSFESEWHTLSNTKKDITLKCPQWEWADVSQGQLVYAEHGRLMRTKLPQHVDAPSRPKLIHDFNDYIFEPIRAPY